MASHQGCFARINELEAALEIVQAYFSALELPSKCVTLSQCNELGRLARKAVQDARENNSGLEVERPSRTVLKDKNG